MKNPKILLAVTAFALACAVFSAAYAADTSATIVTRQAPKPVGEWPTGGYVHARATASGSMTYDVLPTGSGITASKIIGCVTTVESSNGTAKLLKATRSGQTMTIAAGVSDTLQVSDTARTHCDLKP